MLNFKLHEYDIQYEILEKMVVLIVLYKDVTDLSLKLDSHWGQVSDETQVGVKGVWQRACRTGPLAYILPPNNNHTNFEALSVHINLTV